jgi:hypothetical protein
MVLVAGSGITHRIGSRQELSGFFHLMHVFPRLYEVVICSGLM